jgi:hypothetical protein
MPSCLSVFVSSLFVIGSMTGCIIALAAVPASSQGIWGSELRGRRHDRLVGRRYRLIEWNDCISSDWLSDLTHGFALLQQAHPRSIPAMSVAAVNWERRYFVLALAQC